MKRGRSRVVSFEHRACVYGPRKCLEEATVTSSKRGSDIANVSQNECDKSRSFDERPRTSRQRESYKNQHDYLREITMSTHLDAQYATTRNCENPSFELSYVPSVGPVDVLAQVRDYDGIERVFAARKREGAKVKLSKRGRKVSNAS
jgi:hypothetical protein